MRNILFLLFIASLPIQVLSQMVFPDLSPKGHIEQTVGFTIIKIDYQRPAARGRKIMNGLIPFGKMWRTGAGRCTKIYFSKPVTIRTKLLAAGSYSLFTIPDSKEWTVIINNDTSLYGTSRYNERNDVVRFQVKSEVSRRFYESLTFDIDVIPNNAELYLAWEKTQIHFSILTETEDTLIDFVKRELLTGKSRNPDAYANAVEYYLYNNKDLNEALVLINQGIALEGELWCYRLKIDILEKQKKYREAVEATKDGIQYVNKNRSKLGYQQSEIENLESRMHALEKKAN